MIDLEALGISFRPLAATDDAAIAALVRDALGEFGCGAPAADAEVDSMSTAYATDRARYFVVVQDAVILGGGGFAPLEGFADTCELRKMYLAPALRGRGVGRRFLAFLIESMRGAGYARAYLETQTQMLAAQRLYRAAGFTELAAPMGRTGNRGCDRSFLLRLL